MPHSAAAGLSFLDGRLRHTQSPSCRPFFPPSTPLPLPLALYGGSPVFVLQGLCVPPSTAAHTIVNPPLFDRWLPPLPGATPRCLIFDCRSVDRRLPKRMSS